jgi:dinuclear metal center YbgI/SA1388 family protein
MTIRLQDVLRYCNELLEVQYFDDYCPNGLQVEASSTVSRIVTGVTASEALIDAAIARKADLLLVHHGYFWKGESQTITGIKARRIKKLLDNGINLMAYHLPLDAHPELGNNAQLAKLLGWQVDGGLDASARPIGNVGHLLQVTDVLGLSEQVARVLGRAPMVIGDLSKPVQRIAWCTGAAQSYIDKACDAGVDCFISGEISEPTVHIARERGIAYISAGHHATERYGVKALGEVLAGAFSLPCEFVDIDNPV